MQYLVCVVVVVCGSHCNNMLHARKFRIILFLEVEYESEVASETSSTHEMEQQTADVEVVELDITQVKEIKDNIQKMTVDLTEEVEQPSTEEKPSTEKVENNIMATNPLFIHILCFVAISFFIASFVLLYPSIPFHFH